MTTTVFCLGNLLCVHFNMIVEFACTSMNNNIISVFIVHKRGVGVMVCVQCAHMTKYQLLYYLHA